MPTRRQAPSRAATVSAAGHGAQLRTLLATGLLASGLICAATAVTGALSHSASTGWCLGAPAANWLSMMGHCPWCYAALGLVGAAAMVWPQTPSKR